LISGYQEESSMNLYMKRNDNYKEDADFFWSTNTGHEDALKTSKVFGTLVLIGAQLYNRIVIFILYGGGFSIGGTRTLDSHKDVNHIRSVRGRCEPADDVGPSATGNSSALSRGRPLSFRSAKQRKQTF
jgi:hypothetical protein